MDMNQRPLLICLMIVGMVVTMFGLSEAQTTIRISVDTQGGNSNESSFRSAISADGRFVAFVSDATNLIPGDSNGVIDVFVRDRQTGQTNRVSVATGGVQSNDDSISPSLSADGRYVAFVSFASNLVPGDTNGLADVFVHDRQTGQTSRVSVATGGTQGDGSSDYAAISGDGRYVVFDSSSSNLVGGDTNAFYDAFVHDRQTGQTSRVSVATGGGQGNGASEFASLSADGRYVIFISDASNLVGGDTNGAVDVFVHDRQTGQTSLVSKATGGGQGNGVSNFATISSDGRFVAFDSEASNLVGGDTNGKVDVFVHDRQTGQTNRVSRATGGAQGNGDSSFAIVSADGRYVAFNSDATNLVGGDTNGEVDVFVHDRQTGETSRVSVATGGTQGNDSSQFPAMSANGQFVVFGSSASNLVSGDTNGVADIFLHERGTSVGGATPTAFDLNGDGKADIVWRNRNSGVVGVWLLNGTTLAASGFPAGVPAEWQIVGVGDVNGDDKADVIWRHSTSGTVAVWLMNGLTITSVGFPGSTSTDWEIEQIGDVNGDGKADLLWRNTGNGVVALWLMNGATIASSGFLGGVPAEWKIVGIGDVNGDGKADVVWRNTAGIVAIWLMNGLGITSVGFPGSAPLDFVFAGSGDVDGNGTVDLLWRNTGNGLVVVWRMNGASIVSSGVVGSLTSNLEIEQMADSSGDGKADLIILNKTTGEVTVWLLDSLTIIGSGSPGTVSTDWEIQD